MDGSCRPRRLSLPPGGWTAWVGRCWRGGAAAEAAGVWPPRDSRQTLGCMEALSGWGPDSQHPVCPPGRRPRHTPLLSEQPHWGKTHQAPDTERFSVCPQRGAADGVYKQSTGGKLSLGQTEENLGLMSQYHSYSVGWGSWITSLEPDWATEGVPGLQEQLRLCLKVKRGLRVWLSGRAPA